MLKTVVFLLCASSAATTGLLKNPIRKEIVDKIKTLTTSWTPFEADKNPLAGRDPASLLGLILEDTSTVKAESGVSIGT